LSIMDRLLTAGFRHNSRRLTRFARPQPSESLPAPDTSRKYMLYLHVPFCTVLCPFCSFHRVCFEEQKTLRYFKSLRQEIRTLAPFASGPEPWESRCLEHHGSLADRGVPAQ